MDDKSTDQNTPDITEIAIECLKSPPEGMKGIVDSLKETLFLISVKESANNTHKALSKLKQIQDKVNK